MQMLSGGGMRAFLQGLDNQSYHYDDRGAVSDVGQVTLTQTVINASNYYGIYPSSYSNLYESSVNLIRLQPHSRA